MRSLRDLLAPLRQKTEDGSLEWDEVGPDTFESEIKTYKLRTWAYWDHVQETNVVVIQIRDGKERVFDEVRANQDDISFERINALHLAARRSAYNVDEVVSDILEGIGGKY
jgi:hypothetical protein